MLEELAAEHSDLTVSYTVVDKDPGGRDMAVEWQVSAVPTLIFIQGGEEKSRQIGAVSRETLERFVAGFVEKADGSEKNTCGV